MSRTHTSNTVQRCKRTGRVRHHHNNEAHGEEPVSRYVLCNISINTVAVSQLSEYVIPSACSRAPKEHISKNEDGDIPYKPLIMKPNKVGISRQNAYAVVLFGSLMFCPGHATNRESLGTESE